ncbi:MAG: TorF family putative porin [Pseudomonadota bacterium]
MKTLKRAAVAIAVISATGASSQALAAVEANIGVTTDYMWRGVSQSAEAASVSGGLDYADDSGFYIGTWIGSLGDADDGVFQGSEVDLYLGYAGEAGDIAYDFGYILYHYPSIDDGDFGEIYVSGGIGPFSAGVAYTIHSDADDDAAFGEGGIYLNASYGFDITEEFSGAVTIGYYDFDAEVAEGAEDDGDYGHIQLDISKGDFTFSVHKAEESVIASDDLKFVASWGMTF